jgi:hypothetical protein
LWLSDPRHRPAETDAAGYDARYPVHGLGSSLHVSPAADTELQERIQQLRQSEETAKVEAKSLQRQLDELKLQRQVGRASVLRQPRSVVVVVVAFPLLCDGAVMTAVWRL